MLRHLSITPDLGAAFSPLPLELILCACDYVIQYVHVITFIFTGHEAADLTQTVCTNRHAEIAYNYQQMEV